MPYDKQKHYWEAKWIRFKGKSDVQEFRKRAKSGLNSKKKLTHYAHFVENDDVGHFQIHHIDESPSNNGIENLLLICPICHSKIAKCEITQVEVLKRKFLLINQLGNINKQKPPSNVINFNKSFLVLLLEMEIRLSSTSKRKQQSNTLNGVLAMANLKQITLAI